MVNSIIGGGSAELRIGLAIAPFAFRGLKIEGLGTGELDHRSQRIRENPRFWRHFRILASDGPSPAVISDIFATVKRVLTSLRERAAGRYRGLFSQVSTLFHGFPRLSETPMPIVISTHGGQRPLKVTLQIDLGL